MKHLAISSILLIICGSFMLIGSYNTYDPSYVEISTVKHHNEDYNVVFMSRRDGHIKAKYFAAKDFNGNDVPTRYQLWSRGKNIICLTSAGYMDRFYTPVGLTIDNGIKVNETLEDFDGLIIVYATGGVVASNLEEGNLTAQGISNPLNLRKPMDKQTFLNWASNNQATVFQTHLFVYRNQLLPDINDHVIRERRFLAVGTVGNDNVVHAVVNCPGQTTLKDGAERTLRFLNEYKGMNVTFMINLDPGAQNVFFLYDENGNLSPVIKGTEPLSSAANLLVYYYE